MKRESEVSGQAGQGLPTSGLAEELIPLLQKKLGLAQADMASAANESALLAFAGRIDRGGDDRVAEIASVQFVTFQIGAEEYGVPIERVQEILRVSAITRVPGAPAIVRGVVNVRGRLLAVADLASRFGVPALTVGAESRIVMFDFSGRFVGLLVDRVSYVIKVPVTSLGPSPAVASDGGTDLVSGVVVHGGRTILVLDLDRALLSPGGEKA